MNQVTRKWKCSECECECECVKCVSVSECVCEFVAALPSPCVSSWRAALPPTPGGAPVGAVQGRLVSHLN